MPVWEVSRVPAILDLVRGGRGYAALTQTAIRSDSNRDPLSVIPISEPEINGTLCMAQPSQKPPHGAADEHRRNPETARSRRYCLLTEPCLTSRTVSSATSPTPGA